MPRRSDLRTICVIGSGPIVIGQACEFDYAGSQALKVLRDEGFRTIVVNSNPATIMTDPDFADRTYLEPLDVESVAAVLARERPDALLPTLGGQTALNVAFRLQEQGVLDELGIELIGASFEAIRCAEDRQLFRTTMEDAGVRVPASRVATDLADLETVPLPAIVRPAFTLGGHGSGLARTEAELRRRVDAGLAESPVGQVLVEESLEGWDEFELEVMRDARDNVVVVCSIENLDPMGVHTGDSVTVAPQMTLSDEAYQVLRNTAAKVIRAVGVETGGSNIQFARSRDSGELRVIEMNPRVSRSSALASKATGYPIAKVAAKLAVGYTLDEIPNDLTGTTPASFEPTLDYVVVKFPRFAFEKFPGADDRLGTQMKSVGEAMGIGRTFPEAFLKAMRSCELDAGSSMPWGDLEALPDGIHPWFREELERARGVLARVSSVDDLVADDWVRLKRAGWSDADIAFRCGTSEKRAAARRRMSGVRPAFRRVDSCAAEVDATSNYYYSTWGEADESRDTGRSPVVILGSGPNRIGQGIEFDYCCVHAAQSFRTLGYETVMVNCNPETVSTDYDSSDRLYFEPLRAEELLEICWRERPLGVVAQFGGQTPLKLARALADAGIPILGTSQEAVDLAEDRERFAALCERLGLAVPPWRIAEDRDDVLRAAAELGYPVLVRPSYVLGGRAMAICREAADIVDTVHGHVLVDRFLEGAIEIDVDALCDGNETYIGAFMEHVEGAGVHSGDSTCVLPPNSLDEDTLARTADIVRRLGPALGVTGLLNVQLALHEDRLYVLEANPRASRTVPFASKATGVNLVGAACRLIAGERVSDLDLPPEGSTRAVSVKAAVFPFRRFPDADPELGPEMRSTGEVMATASDLASALTKAERAAERSVPVGGTVLITADGADLASVRGAAVLFAGRGFGLAATREAADAIAADGLPVDWVRSPDEPGDGPSALDLIRSRRCHFLLALSQHAGVNGAELRKAAAAAGVPCVTSIKVMTALAHAVAHARAGQPVALQERIDGSWSADAGEAENETAGEPALLNLAMQSTEQGGA